MRISDWSSYVCSSDLATLLEILENAVSNVENVDGRFAQIAGFEFTYDPDRPAGDRVREVTLDDGTDLVTADRMSVVEGKRLSVSADRGGRRNHHKKKTSIAKNATITSTTKTHY